MKFYTVSSRSNYKNYWPDETGGLIDDSLRLESYRTIERKISEYLEPKIGKARRDGDFHGSAYGRFVSQKAAVIFSLAARGKVKLEPVEITSGGSVSLQQLWIMNYVDCLDRKNSNIAPCSGVYPAKVGVIRRFAIDLSKWDGSDIFLVPEDPNAKILCSERFIEVWRKSGCKGVEFDRDFMDSSPIRI